MKSFRSSESLFVYLLLTITYCYIGAKFRLSTPIDGVINISTLKHFLSFSENINKPLCVHSFFGSMDTESDRNLDRFERKAIIEAEKRKKPGECLKVNSIVICTDDCTFNNKFFSMYKQ